MYLSGVFIGVVAFLCIGLFHPVVIKSEYYFGRRIWPVFAVLGIIFVIFAVLVGNVVFSACLAIIGMSCLWSIKELFDQEKRVEKGWFPKNPKRK